MTILLGKIHWNGPLRAIAGLLMAFTIIAPAQGQTIIKPTRNRATATFTMSENASAGVLSGPTLRMSHSEDLFYALYDPFSDWMDFEAVNQDKNPNSNNQPVTISFRGGQRANYEDAADLSNGRRGYEMDLIGCPPGVDSEDFEERCASIRLTIYVEDVPELDTMSGSIEVTTDSTTDSILVGDTLTADSSAIADQEGVTSLLLLWSRKACPDSRGLGTWSISQIVSASLSYQLTNSDIGQPLSIWGSYRTDNSNHKWICKDVLNSSGSEIEITPPPPNEYPTASTDQITYNVDENESAGVISQALQMNDPEMGTISYSIVSLDGDATEQRELRSIFEVRNTAPNPTSSTSQQPIEFSSKSSLNYENTPDIPDLIDTKGYKFGIEGCDPANQCLTIEVTVQVKDVPETSLSSGQAVLTGQLYIGAVVTANFAGFSDAEGGHEHLRDGNGQALWRHGACTAAYGTGELPTTQSSGDSYKDLEGAYSYTIQPADLGHVLSVWGEYYTNTGNKKWVCKQIRSSVSRNPSWPNISISSSSQSVEQSKKIEVTLRRSNINLSSELRVILRRSQNDSTDHNSLTFEKTFPANQNQLTLEVTAWTDSKPLIVEVRPGEGYNHPSNPVTVTVNPRNHGPQGDLIVTRVGQGTRVGETLTADPSGITDQNGISGNFSYTWWKMVDFGPNKYVEEQISGATSSTYQMRRADVQSRIRSKVYYTDDDGYNERKTSAFTTYKVSAADGEDPYVLDMEIQVRGANGSFYVNSGSRFTVQEGDTIDVVVQMSQLLSGISAAHYVPRMNLQVGGQNQVLYWYNPERCANCTTYSVSKLRFAYDVKAGDTGSVTFPTNGMFISNGNDDDEEDITYYSNPSFIGTHLNHPRKYLGYMTVIQPLRISISDATANENTDEFINFEVTLDRPATETITVDWVTENGTALAGVDYTAGSGTLTFNVGESSKTIAVAIIDDSVNDPNENFFVRLSNVSAGVQFTNPRRRGTGIINNTETVTPPPVENNVTASFHNVPTEHDGSSNFTFQLRTSEVLRARSRRSLMDALTITNGSLRNVKKVGTRDNWNVIVRPSSTAAVTISFAPKTDCSDVLAPCTSDNRAVSNSFSDTVLGPAMISIADASAYENTDTTISFPVTLNRAATQTVTVDWATADDTATAGSDYTAGSGTLTFNVGESSKTITVAILNDSIDEGSETFYVNLSNASGGQIADNQAVGTINNSDAMPGAWNARFGRTVASQAVDAISSRMGSPSSGNRVVVGGMEVSMEENEVPQQNPQDPLSSNWWKFDDQRERGVGEQTMTLEDLTAGTSFNLGMKNEDTGQTRAAWGEFASENFEGKSDNVNLKGEVKTGFLGADVTSGNWKGGLTLANSKGEGTFSPHDKTSVGGEVESSLTSVFPYFGYEFAENKALWGILGFGEGDVTVSQHDQSFKADTSLRMGAVGAKGPLLRQSAGDGMNMTFQTDAMYMRMNSEETQGMSASETEVTRLRLMVNSDKSFEVGQGVLTPSFQLGVRHDGGDAEEGVGLEAGGGLSYQSDGVTIEGNISKLLVHEDSDYEEWGASAALQIDPGQSGRGLSLSITPTWGTPSNDVNRLWSSEGLHKLRGSEGYEDSHQITAEVGYGLAPGPLGKKAKPYIGFQDNNILRAGISWLFESFGGRMNLEFEHTSGANGSRDDNAIRLRLQTPLGEKR